MSFHNPREMIAHEVGTVDRLEGVLRQMLSDQQWSKPASATEGGEQDMLLREQLKSLESELQEKQKQIDAFQNNQPVSDESAPLKKKIKDLEDKLSEYSVIEEDIADLSRFRQENDELRKKITEVVGINPNEAVSMPWDEFEKIVKDKKATSAKDTVTTVIDKTE